MRRLLVAILSSFLLSAVAANADSIPTFTANQGTATVTADPLLLVNGFVDYNFSGNGFSLIGSGTIGCAFCISGAPGGYGPLAPGMTIFSEGFDLLTIGGTNYTPVLSVFTGTFTFGPNFSLPTRSQTTFSITLPVTFGGSISPCLVTPPPSLGDCVSSPSGSVLPPLATINFNSKGTATLIYTQQNGLWSFNSATFTLSPVPEPGTFLLMGSGFTTLMGLMWRRRSSASKLRAAL